RSSPVPPDEQVDVAYVIRLENDDHRRRMGIEALPHVGGLLWRGEGIEQRDLTAGGDAGGGDERLPVCLRAPARMLDPPQPEAVRDVSKLPLHGRKVASARCPSGSSHSAS